MSRRLFASTVITCFAWLFVGVVRSARLRGVRTSMAGSGSRNMDDEC